MNHRFRIFAYSFILFISTGYSLYANFSFALEYDGQLKCGIDYAMPYHSPTFGKGSVKIGFRYQETPGTLDDMGHAQIVISAPHSNLAVDTVSQILCTVINNRLDYNPTLINQLIELDKKQKQVITRAKAFLEADELAQAGLKEDRKKERHEALLSLQQSFKGMQK